MNKSEIIKQAFNLLESEYGIQTDHKKEVFSTMLREYPAELIQKATIKYLKTSKFFPFVSDIIKLIEGEKGDEADIAWGILKFDIIRFGIFREPVFRNPTIKWVMETMGGWGDLCNMKVDEEKWIKKEFVRLYEIRKQRGLDEESRREIELENEEIEAPIKEMKS